MNITFRYRVSWLNYAAIAVAVGVALYAFCQGAVTYIAAGFLLITAAVAMAERIAHTAYVFTADDRIFIRKGRLSRPVVIRVGDIVSVETVRGRLLPVRYVLLRYGLDHEVSVQPADEDAFIGEIRRRLEQTDKEVTG